jgi:NAD(P)-dependent dehydrogenase (short-subunit alcohol dehydrogenase family)
MGTEQAPIDSGYGYGFGTTAEEVAGVVDLTDKLVVITGGHSGIGLETTRVLAAKGARVIVGARDLEKARAALAGIENAEALALELSEPPAIDRFCQMVLASNKKIDLLINNAGVMAMPETRDKRGYEMQFATNHLGHFQLTMRLAYALKAAGSARVITLSSAGHRFAPVDLEDPNFLHRPYDKWKAYGQSKTANSLFAVELDRRMRESGVRSFAVHPGRIADTGLKRYMDESEFASASSASPALMKTVEQGAATTVWAATSAQLNEKGGVYCADCEIAPLVGDIEKSPAGVLRWAVDETKAAQLWKLSEAMIRRQPNR